ncbi:glycosyltransferase [Fibrella sp. HMF5335]|uniref:Glycosyltransferase n=2 Tax=Fibrella rubiginis TaxID=2817060 RepID=A0A939K599_9BACT|nr:glycosyltransferase [Fibrella rubiginis]
MDPFLNQHRPWVSVICTCYNQADYVVDSLQSVISQHYANIELVVIDNASTDDSAARIGDFCQQHPAIRFVQNTTNLGLCRAFNQGLALTTGDFVIDLAADDVLMPNRIARQVERFLSLPHFYGVVFSNAALINAGGQVLGHHFPLNAAGHSSVPVPSGDVFKAVLDRYFICTPTMMMRRSMLDELGGYDEDLAFEDFDLWVRSSREYRYAYIDEVLTQKRRLPHSLGQQISLPGNALLESTLRVCYKAKSLCQTPDERHILANRVRQFIRKCFYAEQRELADKFGRLLREIETPDFATRLILRLGHLKLPINGVYRYYLTRRAFKAGAGSEFKVQGLTFNA